MIAMCFMYYNRCFLLHLQDGKILLSPRAVTVTIYALLAAHSNQSLPLLYVPDINIDIYEKSDYNDE